MQILSDYTKDIRSPKPAPGSYEWWYFDAISDDGLYSIVVIFYDGNPFSRRYITNGGQASDFPAISISVYKNDRPIFYGFEEVEPYEAHFSDELPKGNVKENRFSGGVKNGELSYSLELHQILPSGDKLDAELTFRSAQDSFNEFGSAESNNDGHIWNLVQPKCTVTGDITISGYTSESFEFEGTGYHDHNVGSEPMKESFTEWYWGRFHLDNAMLVYYLMHENGSWKNKAWLLNDDGEVESLSEDRGISLSGFEKTFWGLNTARKIESTGGSDKFLIQQEEMIDSGPFYQRFRSKLILHKGDEIIQSRGISEYIYPERIYQRLFWPLVNM
ncbi:MAG: hypothetical protein WD381_08200, partial [Balneolaceae bacterium]